MEDCQAGNDSTAFDLSVLVVIPLIDLKIANNKFCQLFTSTFIVAWLASVASLTP